MEDKHVAIHIKARRQRTISDRKESPGYGNALLTSHVVVKIERAKNCRCLKTKVSPAKHINWPTKLKEIQQVIPFVTFIEAENSINRSLEYTS